VNDAAADRFCDVRRDSAPGLLGDPGISRLCYRTDGDPSDPAVILVAGLGLDLTSWPADFIAGLVSRGLFVVRVDNRDAGRSTREFATAPGIVRLAMGQSDSRLYGLADMVQDTIGVLDHLDIESAHFVGMSMGGMIAQTAAARFPHRVRTLTSIFSTTGARDVGQPAWTTKLLMTLPPPKNRRCAVSSYLAMLRYVGGTAMPIDQTEAAQYAIRSWERAGGNNAEGVRRQINAILSSGDRTAELGRITAPTLVIHGSRDRMVDPSGGDATHAAIPGSRLEVISGMGHYLAPAALGRLIELIDSVTGSSSTATTKEIAND
jgi:pimeloyl-ACP methyl ester carboxylesterase